MALLRHLPPEAALFRALTAAERAAAPTAGRPGEVVVDDPFRALAMLGR